MFTKVNINRSYNYDECRHKNSIFCIDIYLRFDDETSKYIAIVVLFFILILIMK